MGGDYRRGKGQTYVYGGDGNRSFPGLGDIHVVPNTRHAGGSLKEYEPRWGTGSVGLPQRRRNQQTDPGGVLGHMIMGIGLLFAKKVIVVIFMLLTGTYSTTVAVAQRQLRHPSPPSQCAVQSRNETGVNQFTSIIIVIFTR